jgi:hypothetical protein
MTAGITIHSFIMGSVNPYMINRVLKNGFPTQKSASKEKVTMWKNK